jgi:hypothetical protein
VHSSFAPLSNASDLPHRKLVLVTPSPTRLYLKRTNTHERGSLRRLGANGLRGTEEALGMGTLVGFLDLRRIGYHGREGKGHARYEFL